MGSLRTVGFEEQTKRGVITRREEARKAACLDLNAQFSPIMTGRQPPPARSVSCLHSSTPAVFRNAASALTTAPFPSRDCRGLSWTPWQGTLFNLQNITTGNKLKRRRLYFSSCGYSPSCWGRHSSWSLRESVTLYLQSGCRKKLVFSLLSSSGLQPVQ